MTQAELLRLLRQNPYRGMQALTERYAGLLYAVVSARLSGDLYSSAEIEDCVADTFSDFYLSMDAYDPDRSSLKTWLCVLARNKVVDIARKKRLELIPLDAQTEEAAFVEDDAPERSEVLREIKNLGEPDSAILLRKYYLGQSSKEIAKALGMTVSNVDTRTHRAIAKLKKVLGDETG